MTWGLRQKADVVVIYFSYMNCEISGWVLSYHKNSYSRCMNLGLTLKKSMISCFSIISSKLENHHLIRILANFWERIEVVDQATREGGKAMEYVYIRVYIYVYIYMGKDKKADGPKIYNDNELS